MSVKIGHAVHDENNKARGGEPGDQTGGEVLIGTWYDKPWTHVFRAKDPEVAEKIAVACEKGCRNNNIGYDQGDRLTLNREAKKVGYDLEKINTPCEADCSSFVAVCVNAAGVKVAETMYTGHEANLLKNTKQFDTFTTDDYIRKSDKLRRGDILLGKGHTAMVLSNGKNADVDPVDPDKDKKNPYAGTGIGTATAKQAMHIRQAATSKSDSLGTVKKGTQLEVLEVLSNEWYRVVWDKSVKWYGFTSNKGGEYYTYSGEKPEPAPDPTPEPAPTPTEQKYVLTGNYNMRRTPGSANKPRNDIITVVRKGATFIATGEEAVVNETVWLYGKCGAYKGYVSSKGLKKI